MRSILISLLIALLLPACTREQALVKEPAVDKRVELLSIVFRLADKQEYAYQRSTPYSDSVNRHFLINASVLKYLKDHGAEEAETTYWTNLIKDSFHFFWIEELANELDTYDAQRDKYPTLDSYMPQLAKAYTQWIEKRRQSLLSP